MKQLLNQIFNESNNNVRGTYITLYWLVRAKQSLPKRNWLTWTQCQTEKKNKWHLILTRLVNRDNEVPNSTIVMLISFLCRILVNRSFIVETLPGAVYTVYMHTSTAVQQRMLGILFCHGDVMSVQQRAQKVKVNHGQRGNMYSCTEASTAFGLDC